MIEEMTTFLEKWKNSKDNRQLLQDIYLVLGIVIVLLSGLTTFLNTQLGYTMVTIGLVLLGAYLLNAIAWHLASSAFLNKIKKPRRK